MYLPHFGRTSFRLNYIDIAQRLSFTQNMTDNFQRVRAVTRLVIYKYTVQREGICSLCNFNSCT